MAKKKFASTGSPDASVLRRSDRETSSRKQTTSSSVNSRNSERIEKHTSPRPSSIENEVEKQMRCNPLRRSDRGKKLVEIPNIKSTKEKTENNSDDVDDDKKKVKQDSDVGGRKRKRLTAIHYKASFKTQCQRIESDDDEDPKVEDMLPEIITSKNEDVDKELKCQDSIRVQIATDKDNNTRRVINDLDQIEDGDCHQTKSVDHMSIESGDVDKQIGGNISPLKREVENTDNHIFHTSSYRIEHDLENLQEPDTCQKVDVSRNSKEAFEKINREWDEKRATLEHEYELDKCFILALYRNPSIRSDELEKHERLWEIRLKELKATLLAAEGQVAADDDVSLRGSHSGNPEVVPTLPEKPIEVQSHDEPHSHTSEKETVDGTVCSKQIGEVPAQRVDDDMDVDVAEKVDSSDENAKSSLNASDPVIDHNEACVNDVAPRVGSGDMDVPAGNKESDYDGTIGVYTSRVLEDRCAAVDDVAPEVESADVEMPAGTHDVDMAPHVNSGDMEMPAGNYNKVNDEDDTVVVVEDHCETVDDVARSADVEMQAGTHAEITIPTDSDCIIIKHDALHSNKDHNDFSGYNSSSNPVCATLSQDNTPSVEPVSSPAPDHLEPIIPEIQNEPLQLEQLPDNRVQDEEINSNLQQSVANQLDQIIPDNLSTDPTVPESPSAQSREILEENSVAAAETPHGEHQPRLAAPVNPLDMFDNLTNRVSSQMPNPLQAEVERLYIVKDKVTKLHQDTKQNLNSECEKEIAEIVAQIRLKFEAKHQDVNLAFNKKQIEIETNINKVIMNRILAEAFRSKCQDLNPSDHPVSQAGIMQQLRVLRVPPDHSLANQQPPQPPQLQPPVQIVNQPAALFSSTPGRPPLSNTNFRPPFTTLTRPPSIFIANQITSSTFSPAYR